MVGFDIVGDEGERNPSRPRHAERERRGISSQRSSSFSRTGLAAFGTLGDRKPTGAFIQDL